jgi:biopolymer transport protein ExbB/TolQ
MKAMIKLVVLTIIVGFVFITGYYLGSHKLLDIRKDITGLKTEVLSKTTSLEKELADVRARMHLVDARERIIAGKNEISEKNFGTAGKEIEKARELIERAIGLSGESLVPALRPITQELAYAETEIKRLNPDVMKRLDGAKKELDRIIER